MPVCDVCGRDNRPGARFCRYCAAPLPTISPTPGGFAPRPAPLRPPVPVELTAPAEEAPSWLAATLISGDSSSSVSHQAARHTITMPLAPLPGDDEEKGMEQSQPAAPALFGGRYELRTAPAQGTGTVEAVDHQPWRQCWACGSTENQSNDSFCTNCGAELTPRTYRGILSPPGVPNALALITTIKDDFVGSVLPPIWDTVQDASGQTLVLLHTSQHRPVERPLDELTALRVGHDLARVLAVLHQQGIMLGRITPADLILTPDHQLQLAQVPDLHRVSNTEELHEVIAADLQNLAHLLESLTSTPRTTQRLDVDEDDAATLTLEALPSEDEATFDTILRQMRTGAFKDARILAEHLDTLISERTRPQPLRQLVGSASDKGMIRDHNEDSLLVLNLGINNLSQDYTRGLYIVADGMGGHAAGELASNMAIRYTAEAILSAYLPTLLDIGADYAEEPVAELLKKAVLHANEAIRQASKVQGNDMGTTLTLALVVGDRATIANVGDSRTYLYREGKLRRISRDHSLVMRLVELGQLTDEEIYTHPQRNAVLRSLGDQSDIEVDIFTERLHPGDALLLCSDGQWEMTHDPQMEKLLAQHPDPQVAAEELIKAGNQAGGEDNITSILVRFEAP